ncbi:DASH complex subunit dad2 [Malassezia furfur]|uniref:DASH complex subunit DAD2 n=1 Tax=Malassezia furfur TaxID=55194 RepID=A0ABY8EW20_MALFU|nr:DASH complex subunit dad2 [Malassezia furfur]
MAPTSQRSSMAPMSRARMSVAPGAAANARLAAKQAELHALQNLRNESARLAQEMAQLGDRVDTLVAGGISVSSVMSSWQGVFRAIQIAQATTAASREAESTATNGAPADSVRQVPEALVRIPIQTSESTP